MASPDNSKPRSDGEQKPAVPSLSLPKGGGAIRGMGEKFAANPVTGTGSMSVPIATSQGRSGFGPQLSLSYDSGAGNGPFGFGWSLSLPHITHKTEKGLPIYLDGQGQAADSDIFILSGAEDLAPEFEKDANGVWVIKDGQYQIHDKPRTVNRQTYNVRRYRPRIEGLFARIERWTNQKDPADTFWRSISKDNITTWYGKSDDSRVFDPSDKSRIFSWLICQSYDDKGNVIVYRYKKENSDNLDLTQANERNRTTYTRKANRYPKRIYYGNRDPYLPVLTEAGWPQPPDQNPANGPPNYYFEVVFDYEDGHYTESTPNAEGRVFAQAVYLPSTSAEWSTRLDPFSTYRAGFEVRTYRLCQRVLMFHHFPAELGAPNLLVRSTDFTYSYEDNPEDARNPIYSFLDSVSQSGYMHQGSAYLKKSLPPVQFEYTKPEVQDMVEEVDPQSLENLPIGLDGSAYRWTDLHGEGIPGILTEQAGAWFYKRNWSPIPVKLPDGSDVVKASFSALETVAIKLNVALSGAAEFMDLAGDGQPDVVVMDGPTPGLYEHDDAESWQPFCPFTSRLNRDLRDPNLKFVDLDGDGHADALITENGAFVWHASLAEEGFGPARRVAHALDEEKGPRIVFADGAQSIHLADLSGDGLTDIVRIRNGEVCYWPNLGHGRFGAKVTMDNAPWFDHTDQFDHKRIRLADIDGSGATDIIYLHGDGVRLYFNQSGNSWSQPRQLKVFPRIDDLVSIVPTDLLGNGTACLVWSSPLPDHARQPMRYVNLMGRRKPHLLVKTINNLGAETRVDYAPSTMFYLQDKRDGKPWITRLPFPVHVVERVETYDHISRNRFVTRYAYHHGYFDGEEREFRGFGRVDQFDTEEFTALSGREEFADDANIDQASHIPPVVTKTWFHTGVYNGRDHVSNYFAGIGKGAGEYYREPALRGDDALDPAAKALLLEDTILPDDLTIEEEREACRALKGAMLRQEVYALDKTDREEHPYIVTEQNFTIERVQPKGDNRHGVFFTHAREAITYNYERNPADPRIQHALTLEVDDYGNALKQAAIGYGRRQIDASLPTDDDRDKQALVHITYTENAVTNAIHALADDYRTPLPAESRTYELRKPRQERSAGGSTRLYHFDDVLAYVGQAADGNHDVEYEDIAFVRAQKAVAANGAESDRYFRRLIENLRTLYRPDDCGAAENDPLALLALRTLERLALPGESYKLAFTPGLLDQVFQRPRPGQLDEPLLSDPATVLGGTAGDQGAYVDLDDNGRWWIPSGRAFYHPEDVKAADELAEARAHFFLPRRYRDPFGPSSTVAFDGPADPTQPKYDLLMVETRDALGNRVMVEANDYRVLQPRLISDPNRNRTEVAFDALGMVVGTAVMGKPSPALVEGDTLTGFGSDPSQAQIDDLSSQPRRPHPTKTETEATPVVHNLLGNATTRIVYDLDRFKRTRDANPNDRAKWKPPFAATIVRETHVSDLPAGQRSKLQVSFTYSDGFGREIQKKLQAEPDRGVFADEVMADDPLAYYRLGESAGAATVRDSSRHANHAAVSTSGVTLGAPGLGSGDTAALFDGQGSGRIVIPDSPLLNPKRITIEAIISWSGPNGYQQRILEKSFSAASPTWPTYGLSILQDGSAHVEVVVSGRPGVDSVTSNTKVLPNVPTHLAATYDGNTIDIYINGVLDASLAMGGDIISTAGSSNIGIGNQVERVRPFNGVIDELAIYDRALTGDRIRAHVAKVKAGGSPRPRWVGSGWNIFNNKGKPVRQYEPFFSATHDFEFGVIVGVSPTLFYDPAERVIATLRPNHTYEKVVFDPWQQTTYDVNDTCAPRNEQTGDPRTDPDIQGYVAEYFKTQPANWKPWIQQRINDPLNPPADSLGRTPDSDAAVRALAHADTPTTAYFDALGRAFLTVARNRVVCQGHALDGKPDEEFGARVELDIEGNQREVRDERRLPDANQLPLGAVEQRIVMSYAYDMLGNRIRQESMEAGARWMLNDVTGKLIRAWDSRGHKFTTVYDPLRRPTEQYVRGTFSDPDPLKPNSDPRTLNRDILVDKIEYGEPPLNATLAQEAEAQRLNLRTRIYRHLDSAGEVVNSGTNPNTTRLDAYDFKGNLLRSSRRLARLFKEIPDWSQNREPQLDDAERFESSARYDALNRPTQSVAPHSSVPRTELPNKFNITQPVFNEANLLERVHVWMEQPAEPSVLLDPNTSSPVGVANIDYDAKGQRTLIDYKTQDSRVIRTTYAYDPETFRMTHLYTRRGVDPVTAQGVSFNEDCDDTPTTPAPEASPKGKPCGLQNLRYTYDPAGNITHIQDDAQQTIYFKNQRVEPSNDYTYDALYRLIQAKGREHLGQGGAPLPHSYNDAGRVGILSANPPGRFAPNDRSAMGTYIERYVYDAVGNFLQMQHVRADVTVPGWTRRYAYSEPHLIERGKRSNRLSRTTVGNAPAEVYGHDVHGNMLQMPQLQAMQWDYRDQLQMTQRQKVNNEDVDGELRNGERTYYVYDASGQRVRKVTERANNGGIKDERIYLGGAEIFRAYEGAANARTLALDRETLHVMDVRQRIALVETRTLDRTGDDRAPRQIIRYQFGNHLGSASLELNDQAQIISYEEYAPYGSSTYQAVRSQTETVKRYRYTGKGRDEESGLYYHEARYYVSWIGIWTSTDPIGLDGGNNLYAYSAQSPIEFIDPSGNAPKKYQNTAAKPQKGRGEEKVKKVVEAFQARVKANQDKDTGGRPTFLQRIAVESQWKAISTGSEEAFKLIGKNYELSTEILHAYLVNNGEPLVYVPPQSVQEAIAKHFPKPGHYTNVNPYNWGNPDIRNGLGHFNLDVIDVGDNKRMYFVSDRYMFPDKDDKGKTVRHGFQVGKLSDEEAAKLNEKLATLGEFERDSGYKERFDLVKTEKTGEYTLFVPQKLLADYGADIETFGMFVIDPSADTATTKESSLLDYLRFIGERMHD